MFDDEFEERESKKIIIRIIVASVCFVAVLAVAVVLIFKTFGGKDGGDDTPGIEENVDGQPTGDESSGGREDSKSQEGTEGQVGTGGQEGTGGQTSTGGQEGTGGQTSTGGQEGTGGQTSTGGQSNTDPGTEYGMKFQEVNETVTAKDVTNLRNIPSQGAESTVLRQLSNGETATRTGISDSGWSRIVLDGTTYYAVSNYLTTDLAYHPEKPEDDGIKTKFSDCQEQVTPKIEINLRSIPSVTNPNSVVVATLRAGEVFVRTGINTELGWSRVEYNGQVLYCVSSYLNVVE